MGSRFERAIQYVLGNEGIDSDHPLDRGNRTRFGVTQKTAERYGLNAHDLTKPQAIGIYRSEYWGKCDLIADEALAIKVFDFSVNAGVQRAYETLQEAANDFGMCLVIDGILGPKSLLAVNSLNPDVLLRRFAERQRDFYEGIIENDPTQKVFKNGWLARAARVPMEESA